jgi:hypothetical protein
MRHVFHAYQVAYTIQRIKYTSDFLAASTLYAETGSAGGGAYENMAQPEDRSTVISY